MTFRAVILAVAAGVPTSVPAAQAPQSVGASPPQTQRGDWVVDTQWHNGCDRHRWCKARRWDARRQDYDYLECYWGGCTGPNGGSVGYGGHDGRGY